MSMPYVYPTKVVNVTSYSFTTYAKRAASIQIATRKDLSDFTLTMWVDKNSKFSNAVQRGSVQFINGNVVVSLTQSEVDEIKDSYYYIKADRGTENYQIAGGTITYRDAPVDDSSLLDPDGSIRVEFVLPLVNALEDTFLRRDEYVAGVIDPEVLDAAVDNKLAAHVNSETPHPAYDIDAPSFKLLFENGLI